jgi:hypothetical protein
MVSNLGRTCPFALSLMNITMAESNSTYSSKMNVPKNCNKSKEGLWIFNTAGAQYYRQCRRYFDRDLEIEMRIASGQSNKDSLLKQKYHYTHPKSATKIFYHSKPRYPEATRFWYMKSITHHTKSKISLRTPNQLGIAK